MLYNILINLRDVEGSEESVNVSVAVVLDKIKQESPTAAEALTTRLEKDISNLLDLYEKGG